MVNVSLHDIQPRIRTKIRIAGLDSGRVIDRHHPRASRKRHFGEPSCAASDIKNRLAAQLFRFPFGGKEQALSRDRNAGVAVQLRLSKSIPLEPEIARVILGGHETRNEADDWICPRAGDALKFTVFDFAETFLCTNDAEIV